MSELTFYAIQDQFFQLCDEKEYAQAYDLIIREADRFPEHEQGTYYWRMCLASRLNDVPQALQYFKDALARSYWYPTKWLRDDEDLQPLQGLPEYERLVVACQQRYDEVHATIKPELVVVPPEGQTRAPYPLWLALHGNTSNARDTLGPWRWVTSQGWLLALPQSSQITESDSYVWDDWDKATSEVQAHYTTLTQQRTIAPERVILGGFSMGGGFAAWLAVSGAIKARGFAVLGPYLPNVDVLKPLLDAGKADGLRGYIVVGEQDTYCLAVSRKIQELLHSRGIPCELELRLGLKHIYPSDFDKSLEKALAFILAL